MPVHSIDYKAIKANSYHKINQNHYGIVQRTQYNMNHDGSTIVTAAHPSPAANNLCVVKDMQG